MLIIGKTKKIKMTKKKSLQLWHRLTTFSSLAMIGVFVLASIPLVHADSIQQQIDNLNAQNSQAQQTVSQLQLQANSYQDAISKLQQQIYSIQQAISASQARQAQLTQQIQDDEVKLAQERQVLGEDIKAQYVGGQLTPIEMLATSKSISAFVDSQIYQESVANQIQDTLKQINDTETQQKSEKAQVAQLLQSQQTQQIQLDSDRNQQASLLSYNQDQQSQYNQQIAANKKQIDVLIAEQIAIIRAAESKLHYGGTGDYPYADAVCLNGGGDSNCNALINPNLSQSEAYNWGYPPSNNLDPLGWNYRNCTSYVFWKVAHVTGVMLNASNFPNESANGGGVKYSIPDFRAQGYRVDSDPTGSVVLAVNTGGRFGHIMYVESVNGNGVNVSQYNANGDGLFTYATLSSLGSISFVHIK